jgi:hypothetical protein
MECTVMILTVDADRRLGAACSDRVPAGEDAQIFRFCVDGPGRTASPALLWSLGRSGQRGLGRGHA